MEQSTPLRRICMDCRRCNHAHPQLNRRSVCRNGCIYRRNCRSYCLLVYSCRKEAVISSHLYIHVEIGDFFKKVRVFLHELFLKICSFRHETFKTHVKTKVPSVFSAGTFTLLIAFFVYFLRLFSHKKVCLRHAIYKYLLSDLIIVFQQILITYYLYT